MTGDPSKTRADGPLLARRYRLVTQVGRGGMGTVWQAHDEVLGRDVAVKEVILPHGLSDDDRTVQYKRTFREARTAARLGHPGVVTVYDVVEEDGRPWIIMELIKARSLDLVIKHDGPLEPRRAAEVGRQMLAALHAAHTAGVLHRDVKPSNVLLGAGDRAVLTDFGIATAEGDATLTQTGLVMGSPAYIAPERARGKTAGPASDLWSLGVTLYAMVDGRSPFERSEPMAALVAIISEEPAPPASAGPLWPIIEGLLRKDPDERMNAHEAGRLLDDIVREESVNAQRTRPVPVPPEALPAGGTLLDDSFYEDTAGADDDTPPAGQALPAAAATATADTADPEPAVELDAQPAGAASARSGSEGRPGSEGGPGSDRASAPVSGDAGTGTGDAAAGAGAGTGSGRDGERQGAGDRDRDGVGVGVGDGVGDGDGGGGGGDRDGGDGAATATVVDPAVIDSARTRATESAATAGRPPAGSAYGPPAYAVPLARNRTALIVLGIAVAALVVLGVLALLRDGGDDPGAGGTPATGSDVGLTRSASGSPKASGPSSARPTSPKPTTSSAVPAGFRRHKDRTGFSIVIPKDWTEPERKQGGTFFYSPDRSMYLQVDYVEKANPSALQDWKDYAPVGSKNYDGYDQIKIAPVTEGEPQSDPTGKKAADWEFTHQGSNGRIHVLNRGLVMNGHGYAILLSAPDDDWDKTLDRLQPAYELFTPAAK